MFLLIDMSNSNHFGNKKELIAEIDATLSYSANKNHDNVGLIMFTERVEKVIPSQKGKRHILSIIEAIFTFEDLETGETFVLENLKADYEMKDTIASKGINWIRLYTNEDYVFIYVTFFLGRSDVHELFASIKRGLASDNTLFLS